MFFVLYTYFDKARLYEYIVAITITTNFMAYFIPALLIRKPSIKGSSFVKLLVEILVPSLVSMTIFIGLVSVFNIFSVPNFLHNIPLYEFVFFNYLMQLVYALLAAFVATIILRSGLSPLAKDE